MINDPDQWDQFNQQGVGLTGDKSTKVRDIAQPSSQYSKVLQGAGYLGAMKNLARGRFMPAAFAYGGMSGAGVADMALNPAGTAAQTAVDTRWLGKARMNDQFQKVPSFWDQAKRLKKSHQFDEDAYQVRLRQVSQARTLVKLAEAAVAYQASTEGGWCVSGSATKASSASRVKVSSPLDPRANVRVEKREGWVPLRGLDGEKTSAPVPPPGLGKQWSDAIKGLFKRDNVDRSMRENLSPKAVGEGFKSFMGSAPVRYAKIPLGLLALGGLGAGLSRYNEYSHSKGADERFGMTLDALRQNEGFREYGDLLDPETEEGQETLPQVRKGFDIIDKYAPDVAADPLLSAQFTEAFVRGVEGQGFMTADQYTQRVQDAVSLQNALDKRDQSGLATHGQNLLNLLVKD